MATPTSLAELLAEVHRGHVAAHGLRRVELMLPPGQYARRAPVMVEATHLDLGQVARHAAMMGASVQGTDALYCLTLADATVAGQGTVVTAGGALLRESAAEYLADGRAPDGFTALDSGRYALTAPVARHVERPSVLVKRPWYRNYGHWLVDGAALVALLSRARLPRGTQLVIGPPASAAMRDVVLDTLAMIAPTLPVVTQPDDEAWTFSELLFVGPVHVPPLTKLPEGISALRALVLRDALAERRAGRRLFVTRGPDAVRRLDNEAELWAMCAERGFESVALETLPVREQARLFHAADMVVGVKGAGLANLLFCRPDTAVVVLSPGDFPDPFFWDISGQAMGRYVEVFGPLASRDQPPSHNPFTIAREQFAAALAAVS